MNEKDTKEQIKQQRLFMIYVEFLLNKYQTDKKSNRILTKKNGEQYFVFPTILETFYNIEFNRYLNLIDTDFLQNQDLDINQYLKKRALISVPAKFIGKRMSKIIKANYERLYVVFYYLKKKYNIKFTDSFMYRVYIATGISPAVLVFIQIHSYAAFRQKKRIKRVNIDNIAEDDKESFKIIQQIERYIFATKNKKEVADETNN